MTALTLGALLGGGCAGELSGPQQMSLGADAGAGPTADGLLLADTGATDEPAPAADAALPDLPGCGALAGLARFTCSDDGLLRQKCDQGALVSEACDRGCLRRDEAEDDICIGTTDQWSCTEVQGTSKALDGDYYLTSFGCWKDDSGTVHEDSGDNCVPGCLYIARSAGFCDPADSGKQCEIKTHWYTANNGRFKCLQRLRITNPKNGKAVVAVVLDGGPGCWVEQKVEKAILDASPPVALHLFGAMQGWSSKSEVHVVEVDESTPLGPVQP